MESERLLEVIQIQSEVSKLGLNLPDTLALIVERTLKLVNADGAAVELAEEGDMVYRAVSGMAKPYLGLRLDIDTSLSGASVKSGLMLRSDDTELDARVNRDATRCVGLRSMIVMPLKHEEQVIGVLKAMSVQANHFTDTDMKILGLLADVIAASIHFSTRLSNDDLYHQATHDALTGLSNRALFMERLRNILQRLQDPNGFFVVCMLDLNGLKQVNDQFGHRAGDAVLRCFAERLQQLIAPLDTAARLGGDEFALIISTFNQLDELPELIIKIEEMAERPVLFEDKMLSFGVSVGAAIYPDDGRDMDGLLELADIRMYEAKDRHKARLALRVS